MVLYSRQSECILCSLVTLEIYLEATDWSTLFSRLGITMKYKIPNISNLHSFLGSMTLVDLRLIVATDLHVVTK